MDGVLIGCVLVVWRWSPVVDWDLPFSG